MRAEFIGFEVPSPLSSLHNGHVQVTSVPDLTMLLKLPLSNLEGPNGANLGPRRSGTADRSLKLRTITFQTPLQLHHYLHDSTVAA